MISKRQFFLGILASSILGGGLVLLGIGFFSDVSNQQSATTYNTNYKRYYEGKSEISIYFNKMHHYYLYCNYSLIVSSLSDTHVLPLPEADGWFTNY